jgi:ribosomal protein S26
MPSPLPFNFVSILKRIRIRSLTHLLTQSLTKTNKIVFCISCTSKKTLNDTRFRGDKIKRFKLNNDNFKYYKTNKTSRNFGKILNGFVLYKN